MEPASIIREFSVWKGGPVEENGSEPSISTIFFIGVAVVVHNHWEHKHDCREDCTQFEHLALEEQVQVSISAAMEHPVLHLKLVDDAEEHALEDRECIRLRVKPTAVHLLYVEVFVNRQLS